MNVSKRGYTLVEAGITLAIISILSTISLPSVLAYHERYVFRSVLSDLLLDLHQAKMAAIKINNYVAIHIDKKGYVIYQDNGAGEGKAGDWIRHPDEKMLVDCKLPDYLTISTSMVNQRMRFRGQPGVKSGTIALQNQKGEKAEVVISLNGRIRSQRL